MPYRVRTASVALLALALTTAGLADLGPGTKAPKLDVKSWYKGTPVKDFEPGKTYVVEFWATWCGPCRESIPHLTEMAKANKDVTFIGVSIWEDDVDGNIAKFVGDMGDKMDYNVGYSSNKDGMAKSWMAEAGQNGIPTAFIVKDGVVVWIGHPMSMEAPLKEVKAGTFDMKAFKVQFDKSAKANREMMATQQELAKIQDTFSKGDRAAAHKSLDKFAKAHPDQKGSVDAMQFGWLAKEDAAAWEKKAKSMASKKEEESLMMLCSFAIRQTKGTDQEKALGRKALDLAIEGSGGKNLIIHFDAAYFYTQIKDYPAAMKSVDAMLELFPTSQYKDNAEVKASIEKQKADLEAKMKGSGG
ncbi:MAG: TlpA family protein disulfide reductase [Armatimonadetes bacterium]|nr:TlpA family protein disulfide reductase [Armatimonadota bacterium]